ncbi:hypothetical protein CRYUN_Cryun03dG0001800 [Craigia yunnanensis]
MIVVGRQMARSNSTAHHRQHSDNFLDASFSSKWLQSSHFPSSQEFGFYGGGRMSKKSPEPGTPSVCSGSSSLRKNNDEYVSPSELSPGLLDLHSFDTELLPEVPNLYEGYVLHKPVRGKSFNDSEPYLSTNKLTNRPR